MKNYNQIEHLIDFKTLQIKPDQLSQKQVAYAHLIDPRFFEAGVNPYRAGKTKVDYAYETPVDLDEELFYLHSMMDPSVLEQGNVRRFPAGVNEKYIAEKFYEDCWVSEGNHELSERLEDYLKANLEQFQKQDEIKLLDVGPCGGAITTLFAMRALDRCNLLRKTRISLLDIVPNVLEATRMGQFHIPSEMIEQYGLDHAGVNGDAYKALLRQPARAHYYCGDGETLPNEIRGFDIVLSAYTHHHMNLHGRQSLCQQMEKATRRGGFVGVTDFYVKNFEEYMKWYKPHFEKHGDAPPVECPLVSGEQLASWFKQTQITCIRKKIERSFVLNGIKK